MAHPRVLDLIGKLHKVSPEKTSAASQSPKNHQESSAQYLMDIIIEDTDKPLYSLR